MRHNSISPSFFQSEIRRGKLTKEDVELGLSNKCLNDSYLYDNTVSDKLAVVGIPIFELFKKIETLIDRMIEMKEYLLEEEVLLIENIRQETKVYDSSERDVSRPAAIHFGNQLHYPAIPAITYKASNYFSIYRLYCGLLKVIFNRNRYLDRNILLSKVQYLFETEEYSKCKKVIHRYIGKFTKEKHFLDSYLIRCQLELNRSNVYKLLEKYLVDKPYGGSLVASRDLYRHFLNDQKAIDLIVKYSGNEEFQKLNEVVEQERTYRSDYVAQNKALKEYYISKDPRLSLL
jgi:hypothetical protein